MARKRSISSGILISATLACSALTACIKGEMRTDVAFSFAGSDTANKWSQTTKAAIPDEELISDYSLMVFDSHGHLEFHHYSDSPQTCSASLLKGEKYSVCACLNFGYDVKVRTIEELKTLSYHLTYPDEYKEGIPMAVSSEITLKGHNEEVVLNPVRLMSKISMKVDRSSLSEDINLNVAAVRIGNCPKRIKVFDKSRAASEDDCFAYGFEHRNVECSPLNKENSLRISESISLYMLENMQGQFSESGPENDSEKVLADYDSRNQVCSFIEIELDYSSPTWISYGQPLIYRFYLGENLNSLDIERNCHYSITIRPEDDGLKGDGWRIDKTGLKYTGETRFTPYPADYIVGNIGDRIHIGCHLTPSHTPFDVGEEYMADDKKEGIYDYEIDADGHGATLTLTGPGRGLIYMEAGDPLNEAALFMIEVNLPK